MLDRAELIRVGDIMTPFYRLLPLTANFGEAVAGFLEAKLDALPVADANGALAGIITKSRLYTALLDGATMETPIQNYVIREVVTISEDSSGYQMQRELTQSGVSQGVVINRENKVVGMITKIQVISTYVIEHEAMYNELRLLLDTIQDGVVAINNDERIFMINQKAAELLGIANAQELWGEKYHSYLSKLNFPVLARDGSDQQRRNISSGNKNIIIHYQDITFNGALHGRLAVLQDVTDYEHLAGELDTVKKLKNILETVVEQNNDGIVVVDEKGTIILINAAMRELLGDQDILGQQIEKVFPRSGLDETLATVVTDLGSVRSYKGRKCVISRTPLVMNGEIKGVVGKVIFRGLQQLKDVFSKVDFLEQQVNYYKDELKKATGSELRISDIVGTSAAIQGPKAQAAMAARGFSNILIIGETGTGKELFARAIHNESARTGPYVKVNCAAIPENLLESEFFGFEEGSFTGARKGGKPGKFELANNGTILLDEIGDMPLSLQAKLLRILQDHEVERIGGTRSIKVNVRVIASTNQDLEQLIQEGRFREDLYYRLNVLRLDLPPLRERREDIPLLIEQMITKFNRLVGTKVTGVSAEALEALISYPWPGNVRELENVIERSLNLNSSGVIESDQLPPQITRHKQNQQVALERAIITKGAGTYEKKLLDAERSLILAALREAKGNRTKAAKLMGVSRATFYRKLDRLGLSRE